MKHLFIINPHAGKYDRSHEIREKVARVMEGGGKTMRSWSPNTRATAGKRSAGRRSWENPCGSMPAAGTVRSTNASWARQAPRTRR